MESIPLLGAAGDLRREIAMLMRCRPGKSLQFR
jgi:hypothetical protein